MGFFDWLKKLFIGEPARPPSQPPAARSDIRQVIDSSTSSPAPASARTPNPAITVTPPSREGLPSPESAIQSAPVIKNTYSLNADEFLPIERQDLREQAKNVRLGGAWFGRRDLIPPADDLRTKLIDRGMVTQGLLSAEELIEIHKVGAEMDRVRPQMEAINRQAAAVGEAAVQVERERRAKLKAEKKSGAAERRKKHADAIAHRRATDILYLGRGVSGRLGDRQSDSEKLAPAELPVLSTPAELAAALGLSIPRLRWLAFHTEVASRVHYVSFNVPKKSGGTRRLSAPHRTLKTAQEWIRTQIVDRLKIHHAAHGFVAERSILTNAQPHVGKSVVINLDLQDFFPSITFPRVRHIFQRAGYSPATATILALLCTECPRKLVEYDGKRYHVAIGPRGLPQGASTSPGLSNQVARRLDRRLHGLAVKLGSTYTRYADDLSFSGGPELQGHVGYLMARVRHIAEEEGFAINEKKSRVLRRNTAQRVTGLVVNDRPGIGRKKVRRLRAILHRARVEGLDQQNRDGLPDFRAWLTGKLAYLRMVRPEIGVRLTAEMAAIEKRGER